MTGERPTLSDSLRKRLERAVERADRQLRRTVQTWPATRPAPIHTVKGRWHRPRDLWTDWTPGFYAGQMWILHKVLGEEYWRKNAEDFSRSLADRRFDRGVHDLGFIFLSSYGRWLEVLEDDDPLAARLKDVLVTAGTVQSFRWNGNGEDGFIYSFNGPQSLFIDVMMNVRLLFAAHRISADARERSADVRGLGDPDRVLQRALEHSRTSARYLVRTDGNELGAEAGSVAHEAIFNTEPGRGEFRCLSTQQGYSPFTCWARGLAWALYGFAAVYRDSGEKEFLEVAERCAEFYQRHTPENGVPHWEYGAPNLPDEPLDSSAAAVAGCGLLILSALTKSAQRRASYVRWSLKIAETLADDEFLGSEKNGEEGVLLHGVYHRPRGWGVDASSMWGDYFFLELLERLLVGAGRY